MNPQRPESRVTKMDMFVPSPGLSSAQYAISPYSSIYDQDKSEFSAMCDSVPLPHSNMDDLANLDESFENSTLKNFFKVVADFPFDSKPEKAPATSCADSVSHNPTLAQLNMDDFLMEDILNLDQEASKLSDSSFDFFNSDISNSPSQRPFPQVQTPSTFEASVTVSCQETNYKALGGNFEAVNSTGSNYVRNMQPMKNVYFPPRQINPPVVAVAPVQQPAAMQTSFTPDLIKQEPAAIKSSSQPSNMLQELLCKKSSPVLKSEPVFTDVSSYGRQNPSMVSYSGTDMPAQIVPSSDLGKRDSDGNLRPQVWAASSLVKDESTEERWEDIEKILVASRQEPPLKKRRHGE